MPKVIENYRRQSLENDAKESRKRRPFIPFAIIAVLVIFIAQAWSDSSSKLTIADAALAEKSKLCLVEFTQKKCDTLNPFGECKNLMKCIEEKEKWQGGKMWEFWKLFSEEILGEFAFPTMLIVLLLLIEMPNALKSDKNHPHDE